jgi:hypothetical protein
MTDDEYDRKRDELDKLLNDPETPLRPDRIWALAEQLVTNRTESEYFSNGD